jgi:hypothetical protein
MIDEGPDVMRFELQALPANGDGWTVGSPRALTDPATEDTPTPPHYPCPLDPWAGPLTGKPKRRWWRRRRAT